MREEGSVGEEGRVYEGGAGVLGEEGECVREEGTVCEGGGGRRESEVCVQCNE